MYIYIHIYTYSCRYIYTYIHTYIYTYIWIDVRTHIEMQSWQPTKRFKRIEFGKMAPRWSTNRSIVRLNWIWRIFFGRHDVTLVSMHDSHFSCIQTRTPSLQTPPAHAQSTHRRTPTHTQRAWAVYTNNRHICISWYSYEEITPVLYRTPPP